MGTDAGERREKHAAESMPFDIPTGDTFVGGSTWQSLMKGASTLETDYFNGEILMLGRLHGVPRRRTRFCSAMRRGCCEVRSTPDQCGTRSSRHRGGGLAPCGEISLVSGTGGSTRGGRRRTVSGSSKAAKCPPFGCSAQCTTFG